ncbi:MAG: hypothetical protein D6730_10000 [Bacteroidetes bacterium]|nr:MAG: hypothetical protein D6730_10000 [Bacteroidota bacterium]
MRKKVIWLIPLVLLLAAGIAAYYFHSLKPPAPPISEAERARIHLMPLPAALKLGKGALPLQGRPRWKWAKTPTARLEGAARRLEQAWAQQVALDSAAAGFEIKLDWQKVGGEWPQAGMDESYSLRIGRSGITLRAAETWGVLRGMESLAQLLQQQEGQWSLPFCRIKDKPRFAWRGLMLDVVRHWMPKEVVLRTLDGMAAVKMNVLHLHLTDDQGFRLECRTFPKLHQVGASGQYYSQADMREIIEYAADRGIRILPEFDMPGHTGSWLAAYPGLAGSPGPHKIVRTYGMVTAAMNPARDSTYEFLRTFLGEMATLFPDSCIHTGGDEVRPQAWEGNEEIRSWMQAQQLADWQGVQAWFNRRIHGILDTLGKKMVGWEEIMYPTLPRQGTIVQSWLSHSSLFRAAAAGFQGVLSHGWYLDHKLPAKDLYAVDPMQVKGGLNIRPDSLWRTYQLEMMVRGEVLEAALTLFGQGDSLRGVWSMMENLVGIPQVNQQGNQLSFEMEGPMGKVQFEGEIQGREIQGRISLAFLSFDVKGRQSGGPDIAGSRPPAIEPVPVLDEAGRRRILGGEACMWSEVVNAETVDSRIWPRSAAVAEKLWSPASLTQNTDDMYRRLEALSASLTRLGLTHESYRLPLLRRIAPNSPDLAALETLVEVLEETKYYQRLGGLMGTSMDAPLESLADAAAPESRTARLFQQQVEAFLADSTHQRAQKQLLRSMRLWEANHRPFLSTIQQNPHLAPYESLSKSLSVIAHIGIKAVHALANGQPLQPDEHSYNQQMLELARKPVMGAELAVVDAIEQLVQAAEAIKPE